MIKKIVESDILNATILIVDDQQANITLLEQMLYQARYTSVSSTMNPREVAALHRRNRYDLIVLDLQMPGMDGFQVMQELKTDDHDSYLPVLVITAQPEHKLRALNMGAKDFVSKPFDLLEVRTRIHNLVEVRLLYKWLAVYNADLEISVQERTAQLQASEARYHALTDLASDWYWEQDEAGRFTTVSGPVQEMIGIHVDGMTDGSNNAALQGWNEVERADLRARIAARLPFLDFVFTRTEPDGTKRQFRVSGEPIFNRSLDLTGYRGVGAELRELLERE